MFEAKQGLDVTRKIQMRRCLASILILLFAAVIAGCGGSETSDTSKKDDKPKENEPVEVIGSPPPGPGSEK